MKKLLLILSMFPLIVFGDSLDFGSSLYNCSRFADDTKKVNGTGEFNYCIKETCENGRWKEAYAQNRNMLTCSNGNIDFYTYTIKSGCSNFIGSCSTNNEVRYCGLTVGYDCNKINNGSIYIKRNTTITVKRTTSSTKRTTKRTTSRVTTRPTTNTTTTTTVPVKDNNSFLKNLGVNGYSIEFNKEKLSYEIIVDGKVDNLDIYYETESDKATVAITNDKNINMNNPIVVSVTAEDGSKKDYTISLKNKTLSNNVNVKKMTIDNYEFIFEQDNHDYDLIIKNEDVSLVYNIELEDNNARYEIEGNSDLVNGSKIIVKVIAEDGTESLYNFNIIKESASKQAKKKNGVLISFLVIIILGIIGVVAFKFIRNMIPAKKDEKYDYE